MSQPEKREHLYKILVIGELGKAKKLINKLIKIYIKQSIKKK
jgi:hypothetical protein